MNHYLNDELISKECLRLARENKILDDSEQSEPAENISICGLDDVKALANLLAEIK